MINGELWSQTDVVTYIKTVYSEDNLTDNVPEEDASAATTEAAERVISEVLEDFENWTEWTHEKVLETKEKIVQYCVKP